MEFAQFDAAPQPCMRARRSGRPAECTGIRPPRDHAQRCTKSRVATVCGLRHRHCTRHVPRSVQTEHIDVACWLTTIAIASGMHGCPTQISLNAAHQGCRGNDCGLTRPQANPPTQLRNVSAAAATLERSAQSIGFRGAVERETTIVRQDSSCCFAILPPLCAGHPAHVVHRDSLPYPPA